MATRELTYDEAVNLFKIANGSGEFERFETAWANWGQTVTTQDVVDVLKAQGLKDVSAAKVATRTNRAGNISGYVAEWDVSYPSVVDSNIRTSGTIKTPINTTATVVEERSVMSAKVGLREAGKFAIGSVVPAVAAAGIGITLGKTIDSALYNLNPDFWDAHNMSSLDPTTWDTITSDYDGTAGTLFDIIFGLNDDGTSQAYINEDALAYIAQYMNTQGAFADGTITAEYTGEEDVSGITQPLKLVSPNATYTLYGEHNLYRETYFTDAEYVTLNYVPYSGGYGIEFIAYSKTSPPVVHERTSPTGEWRTYSNPLTFTTADGTRVYIEPHAQYTDSFPITNISGMPYNTIPLSVNDKWEKEATIIYDGSVYIDEPPAGIGTQDGATTPDTTGWTTIPNVKQSLQQQYPDLWTNAKHQDYVDDNGNNKSTTLIPINLPNSLSPWDTQPTSGNRNQQDPLVDPTTATEDLLKTITDTITKLIDGLPTDTGSGNSSPTVTPVGSASSLWKIYNPTQAQVDAFGAWLWSSDFVDQIKKLFNDPMQGIIGIHKVFASPSIGGSATIKVGYLDSQVPSDWVSNQYTTIDCGTIHLYEEYGNVFDYSPYTKVSLYLPFIGIVDLDVADIMRSSIKVKYHVDVLSGACLADVIVSRDGATAVMYQYSGSAIVTYPVSSGNYMGMVAGVLSVASGIAGTILSGGALAPALIGGAVGASHLHTDVQKSGGFSGCAGAMANKKPYLIISRPQIAMASNYPHFTGIPANSLVTLSQCSGFTRVKSVYVKTDSRATDEERAMIEAKLKEGVLI